MFLSWMKSRASRICLRNPCTSSSKGTISSSKTFWKSPPGALKNKKMVYERVLIWAKKCAGFPEFSWEINQKAPWSAEKKMRFNEFFRRKLRGKTPRKSAEFPELFLRNSPYVFLKRHQYPLDSDRLEIAPCSAENSIINICLYTW